MPSARCGPAPDVRLRTLAEVTEYLGVGGRTGIIDGTEIRMRRPAAGRKDRDKFVSGKTNQNAVKSMVLTDAEGRMLFCSDPLMEILADAGYQGMGAQTGGQVVTPPHRQFKKNAPAWYEERNEQQRKVHSSRRRPPPSTAAFEPERRPRHTPRVIELPALEGNRTIDGIAVALPLLLIGNSPAKE
ncbi:hypothetical protein AB0D91_46175 [Streptomyces canus]|uniref:hypothetical protein n=1 Tax=Streptomyces canus TaxID=58343 RepID=UPI0033F1B026